MAKNKNVFKQIYIVGSLIGLIALSTALYSRSPAQNVSNTKKAQSNVHYIAPTVHVDSSFLMPVETWKNKKFIVLSKLKLFRKFGYELYLSKSLSANTAALDTARETDKHHVRYEVLCGKTLIATEIIPAGGEYLVTFVENGTQTAYYSKTHKHAVEGLALADDIDNASKQWVGKTVFSRRRSIDVYDSLTGTFSNIKVRIQDPLRVSRVIWGTSPMPPKPVWLCVKTATDETGIIPIMQSFANIMTDKIASEAPWQEDLFDTDPTKIYAWDSLTWKEINTHSIVSGMNKEQVLVSWGQPQRIALGAQKPTCTEQWFYGSQYLCFDHDSVASIGGQ